ncbi:MAG: FecCD family ABC transporter permease [Paracoccus sp. (in: a-proteobacteria)]
MTPALSPIQTRRTSIPVLLLLVLILTGLTILGAGIGSSFIPPEQVINAIFGAGNRTDDIILWTLRLPRVALALASGAALALAGAILQRVIRNPLAAPSILGITDGAATGVVAFLWVFSDANNNLIISVHWQPLAAIIGAIVFTLVTGILVFADPRSGPLSLILYGIAMAALAKAIMTLLIILGPIYRASQAMTWLTGSVGAAHWSDVAILSTLLAATIPLLILAARPLTQMQLDNDSARATGLTLGRAQVALILLAVILTSAAVAFVGAIGFVGLIAPHMARELAGQGRAAYLPATALIGACLVLGADILARILITPLELPTGAITALIGAPLFLTLLIRRRSVLA